ncbi:hypothetical protein HXX76_011417 [Chlamydomonas incerta]|uniref:C2 domain-containing protein n=1 Tax=Chlamydomonas incerta TaxID=51695 RepID=A0A835VWR5_CHLIN|nr:hypothetical protein HXX76_011417 [Chlamydomonas incerta]|eukprot:KAG2428713.1 hypothetical protein HXX76_011417 [Chlamydomonas incerta]
MELDISSASGTGASLSRPDQASGTFAPDAAPSGRQTPASDAGASGSDDAGSEPGVAATVWPTGIDAGLSSTTDRATAAYQVPPTPSATSALQRAAPVIKRGGGGSGGGGGGAAAGAADPSAAATEPPLSPATTATTAAAGTAAPSPAAGGGNSTVAALLRRINAHLPHPHYRPGSAAAAAAAGNLAVGSLPGVDAAAAAAVAATNRAQYASAVAASMQRLHRDTLTAADLFLVVHVEAAADLQPGRRGGLTTCDPYVKGWLQWSAAAGASKAAAAVQHTPAQKTRVLYVNRNPMWHQRLAFGLAGVGEAAELCLQVKDFDGLAPASVAGQVTPLPLAQVLRNVQDLGRDQTYNLDLKAEDGTPRPGQLRVHISVHEQSSYAQATVLADAMERRATVAAALRGRRLHVGCAHLGGLTGLRGREHDLVLEFRLCGVVVHRPLSCMGFSGGRAQPQQLDGGDDAAAAAAAAVGPLLAEAELSLDEALREPLGQWAEEQKFGDVHVTLLLHKKKDGGLGNRGGGGGAQQQGPTAINPGDYKPIARTQVPLWDVNMRPRPNTVAAGEAAAAGGGAAAVGAVSPAAVPIAQRVLAGLAAAKGALPRGWAGPLLAAAVAALVAAKLLPLLGLLSAGAATVISAIASLAFMLGFYGLAEAASAGTRRGAEAEAEAEPPRPQLAEMDLAAPPLVYGRWYSRRMEQLDEAVFRAPAAQAAAAAGVARGMRKAAAAAATEPVEARLVLEIMPPPPLATAAAIAAAEVPLPVDFDAPDVDAPAAPLPPAATAGLPDGVSVCGMVMGCGPHAAFKHLFAPGSELASRVAVAQGVMGMMVLKPWTAGASPPPLMSCEMTYKAKSKWPLIPDSAATQKQEVVEKGDGGWVVQNCILPDVSAGLVAIRVKVVGTHAGPGKTLLTATLTVEHTHETQRSGLFRFIKGAAPGATQGYYAELRKQMQALGISVTDAPTAAL